MGARSYWRQRIVNFPCLFVLIFEQFIRLQTSYPADVVSLEEYMIKPSSTATESNRTGAALFLVHNRSTLRGHTASVPIPGQNDTLPYYDSLLSPTGKLRCWNPELRCQVLRDTTVVGDNTEQRTDITSDNYLAGPKTLALVDPMFQGGYRNQFMSFVALTIYALTNGINQMLLPSIRWNCQHGNQGSGAGVPFEVLFDVDYWNNNRELPRLVRYNESEHFDWDPFTGLFHGACDVLDTYINGGPRGKNIILNRTSQYQHPVPYGGGYSLGNLFYRYTKYDKQRPTLRLKGQNKSFLALEETITRAMKPSPAVEKLIQTALGDDVQPPYIALHARFEPDMLVHGRCKSVKVYNLADVFDMIRGMNHSNITNPSLYIAINWKDLIESPSIYFKTERQKNKAALEGAATYGLDLPSGENMTVLLSGHRIVHGDEMLDVCAHEIVSSVVSFEIAVRAKIFIGTYVSSWSTTVWKARHYLGHGENYAYTPKGLEKIEGVPRPFRC